MGQGEQQFSSWAQEVLKQARRCMWQDYDEKAAKRDAILYQTTDSKLKAKMVLKCKNRAKRNSMEYVISN